MWVTFNGTARAWTVFEEISPKISARRGARKLKSSLRARSASTSRRLIVWNKASRTSRSILWRGSANACIALPAICSTVSASSNPFTGWHGVFAGISRRCERICRTLTDWPSTPRSFLHKTSAPPEARGAGDASF